MIKTISSSKKPLVIRGEITNVGALQDFFEKTSYQKSDSYWIEEGGLNSIWQQTEGQKPIKLNWQSDLQKFVKQNLSKKKEPLSKALGLLKGKTKVWDLTCGTGKDTLLMLALGAQVTAFERNPYISALILLQNFQHPHFNFFPCSAREVAAELPDVIYYDPMFSSDSKEQKSLPRKEMQVFNQLVGADHDQENFLSWAVSLGPRVVVKRAIKAPALIAGVHHCIKGNIIRYDVY